MSVKEVMEMTVAELEGWAIYFENITDGKEYNRWQVETKSR